jgi:HEAT repeat protein
VSSEQLQSAIDQLGNLDYAARTAASRAVRRTAAAQAVPALLRAVAEHRDGYVRYRALVLLTGFNDPRTKDAMRESLASPNDRLRTVAYSFFEHSPEMTMVPDLLKALEKEQAEFVRPALVRALAAVRDDPRVRETLVHEVGSGEDFFRSAVIEALGDYKAQYSFDAITAIAKLDGPLLDDAAIALGKIGDKRALETLAGLQRTAPQVAQPFVAAAICLLGVNCESHENYLIETLKFGDRNIGFQELLRGAAAGLAALGVADRATAVDALLTVGIPSRDPTRAPVALALGMVALRNTRLMLSVLERHPTRSDAIALVAEGFDMLEEDLDKERFFAYARRTYWDSAEGSASRELMQTLIGKLDF